MKVGQGGIVEAAEWRAYNYAHGFACRFPGPPKLHWSELVRTLYDRFGMHSGEGERPRLKWREAGGRRAQDSGARRLVIIGWFKA
jgi:hypothetical protein